VRIWQCRTSRAVRFFGPAFTARHGLEDYSDRATPALFFGVYHRADLEALRKHEAPAVVLWAGSDALRIDRAFFRARRDRVFHLAQSRSIERDLRRAGLPYRRLNVHGSDLDDLTLEPLGTDVYVYQPRSRAALFAPAVTARVRRAMPGVRFHIVGSHREHPREELIALYRQCCIGLRLTSHDGCANTVLELGMMGRRCVHNGDQPNAVGWKTPGDVVRAIKTERGKAGRTHRWMPDAIRKHLELPQDWLDVDFWKGA
jgi:hypothetical protein